MKTYSTVQVLRLIEAAKDWAAYQEGDRLDDQSTDERLRAKAIEARERLLDQINALD